MTYVAVLPSVYPLWTERCLETMSAKLRKRVLVVDNTSGNKGVAASWNQGIDYMNHEKADWLIILSASIRFGKTRGNDLLQKLDEYSDAYAVEAAYGLGWHLIAFHRRTIEAAGRFDENFWPAYYEDLDYGYRVKLALELDAPFWPKVDLDVSMAGFEHGMHLAGIKVDGAELKRYLDSKWGDPPSNLHPYNDLAKPVQYWHPTPRGGVSGY